MKAWTVNLILELRFNSCAVGIDSYYCIYTVHMDSWIFCEDPGCSIIISEPEKVHRLSVSLFHLTKAMIGCK